MKSKILSILIMVLSIQCSSAQDVNINEYSNKILGKWCLSSFNNISEKYETSNSFYLFKTGNVLEQYDGSELISTTKYEISYITEIKNGVSIKYAKLIITDDSFGSIDKYSLYIYVDNTSVLNFSLEAEGSAVTSLYIKV